MSFDIAIKVDPGNTIPTLKKVEDGLSAAEKKAKDAAQAISSGMKSAEPAVRSLNEQIENEKRMFDQLKKPMRDVMNDMDALSGLYRKGTIDAREYTAEVKKLREATLAQNQTHLQAPSAEGGGLLGKLKGFAGEAAPFAAAAGIGVGAQDIIEMSDAYTGLQNRLTALTGSQASATTAFDKLHASADRTRSDINSTASSFIQFSRATRDMGLSQDQVIGFTEHLNEAISMSGADSQAASNGLMQLSQAMATGALRGQDLHSVMEQIPVVAQVIQDHLHVTSAKFREMAENGQLTSKVIIDSFNEAGASLDRGFAESVPTISQQFQVFKNDLGATVGEMMKTVNASGVVGESVKALGMVVKVTADQFKYLNDSLDIVGLNMGDLTGGGLEGIEGAAHLFANLDYSIDGLKNALTGTVPPAKHYADQQSVINRVVAEGTGKLKEYDEEMIENALRTQLGANAAKAFRDELNKAKMAASGWDAAAYHSATLNDRILQLLDVGAQAWDKITEKTHKQHKANLDILGDIRAREGAAKAHASLQAGFGDDLIFKKAEGHEYKDSQDADKKIYEDIEKKQKEQEAADKKHAEYLTKQWHDQIEHLHDDAKALGAAFAPLGSAIEDAFKNGTFSVKTFEGALKDVAFQMLEMGLLSALGGGSAGAFVGAALGHHSGGGDFMASTMPHASAGNDWMIRGGGATDTRLVQFMASDNESVHIRTPSQRAVENTPSERRPGTSVLINMQNDRRDLVQGLNSTAGERMTVKLDRKLSRRR